MRFGESFGEACRFCGSTEIIVWPPSSAGNCAHCSEEAIAWDARLAQLADRRLMAARAAFVAAEAHKRAVGRRQRRAARRAAFDATVDLLARTGASVVTAATQRVRDVTSREARLVAATVQRARRSLMRALPARSDTAHNF